MAIEVHLSSYVPNVRKEASEMVRSLGRRTQRPLWVRQDATLENIIYFDSGGTLFGLPAHLRSRGAAYLEYQLFPKGEAPIYLLSPCWEGGEETDGFPMDDEKAIQLAMRCIRLQKRAGNVLMISSKEIRSSHRYARLLSDIKMVLGHPAAVEREACALGEAAVLGGYRVILTDAFFSETVLRFLLRENADCAKIVRIGCKKGNVYTLCEEDRSVCFSPSKTTLSMAAFCFYAWLEDEGETEAAGRLRCAIEGLAEESTLFSEVTALIRDPCRHQRSDAGQNGPKMVLDHPRREPNVRIL